MNSPPQDDLARQLVELLRSYGGCVVAFSGGVDSAVVAKAAQLALGERAVAATGIGPAVAEEELATARRMAKAIGIGHREIPTAEMEQAGYRANAPDRCYHCKQELYIALGELATERALEGKQAVLVNGTNTDDLGDYRPGLKAATEHQVRSPLVECGVDKKGVRALAKEWGLEIWDKPAAPCLASRIAYGQEVTPERLRRIDLAEQYLRRLGLSEVRVRLHEGNLARIEVPVDSIGLLTTPKSRQALVERFTELGFQHISLDLAGFRSGSLNQSLPVQVALGASPRYP